MMSTNIVVTTVGNEKNPCLVSKQLLWKEATESNLNKYQRSLEMDLQLICIPVEAAICNEPLLCEHGLSIQFFYDNVSSAITRSAKLCIPMRKNKMTKKLGWNDELKMLKRASNKDYSIWMAVGKPRHGLLYGSMLKSRKQFN